MQEQSENNLDRLKKKSQYHFRQVATTIYFRKLQ